MIPSFSFRDLSARLGLKDGWKEALSALAVGGVPTFVFSSGHGDVISQVILPITYALQKLDRHHKSI